MGKRSLRSGEETEEEASQRSEDEEESEPEFEGESESESETEADTDADAQSEVDELPKRSKGKGAKTNKVLPTRQQPAKVRAPAQSRCAAAARPLVPAVGATQKPRTIGVRVPVQQPSTAAAMTTPQPRERISEAQNDTSSERLTNSSQRIREENIAAMLGGSLDLKRKALVPKLLTIGNDELLLRKPFKSPHPSAPDCSQLLRHKLLLQRRFVPWGSKSPLPLPAALKPLPVVVTPEPEKPPETLDPNIEPLVLWEAPEGETGPSVEVDPMLTKFLRPHQREGVQFIFECVTGLKQYEGQGCILADDMGLGKTLQGITLLWTMLQSGHESLGGNPLAKRIIICCPTSLVNNWDSECIKWLKGRVKTLPLCESSREDVVMSIQQFISPRNPYQVMIVSYETFRIHAEKFQAEGTCDLLICDEAHRLKNDQTLTNKALASMACKRRVLLSGTPLQNHLDEFYAMVNFCNPGVLGTPAEFRKHFEAPILQGREPDSTADEAQLGLERSEELSSIVNAFILRRTNALLSAHLPPKVIEIVCCKMTSLQNALYNHFLASNAARSLLAGKKSARVLSAITSLKKLCNHPKLIYDTIHGKKSEGAEGFEGCSAFFPPGLLDDGRAGRGGMCEGWEMLSGKFAIVSTLLDKLRRETNDRIVIVSNYTQTLDLFQVLCRSRNYPCLRLDGTTALTKRQKLVTAFNDFTQQQFVFLLSSKAGGCGLNLVGGNRLVLFDPDWNPANDKQAAGRVWRDGQQKRVFVYRFLSTGTIEEKVLQRQLSKEGLQNVVNNEAKAGSNLMSSEELKDLFTLRSATVSDTYDSMCCSLGEEDSEKENSQPPNNSLLKAQVGAPAEEDLKNWGLHTGTSTVPDEIMQRVGSDLPEIVSFVFTCQVAGKEIQVEDDGKDGPSAEAIATGRSSLAASGPTSVQESSPAAPAPDAKHSLVGTGRPSRLKVQSRRSLGSAAAVAPQAAFKTPAATVQVNVGSREAAESIALPEQKLPRSAPAPIVPAIGALRQNAAVLLSAGKRPSEGIQLQTKARGLQEDAEMNDARIQQASTAQPTESAHVTNPMVCAPGPASGRAARQTGSCQEKASNVPCSLSTTASAEALVNQNGALMAPGAQPGMPLMGFRRGVLGAGAAALSQVQTQQPASRQPQKASPPSAPQLKETGKKRTPESDLSRQSSKPRTSPASASAVDTRRKTPNMAKKKTPKSVPSGRKALQQIQQQDYHNSCAFAISDSEDEGQRTYL